MTEPSGSWRAGVVSDQWKIRWVGSTGDPAQRSGVWEAPRQTRSRGVSAGAGLPQRSQRARPRRGPGRAAGPLGGLGGSYLGLRRGGHCSPLLFGKRHLLPAAPGSGRRRPQRLRPPRVKRFQEGGPSCLRVRESGRRASPALSERLRPAREGTSPAAPRPESTRRTVASAAVAASAGAADASSAASHSPCGTLSSHRQPPPRPSSAQARAPPTPRTRPRPERLLGCRRAGARALTSHAPYRLPEPASLPALPPHVTPPERTAGACAGTPHSSAPGGPAQTFLPHLTAELGTLPRILTLLERNVARLG